MYCSENGNASATPREMAQPLGERALSVKVDAVRLYRGLRSVTVMGAVANAMWQPEYRGIQAS